MSGENPRYDDSVVDEVAAEIKRYGDNLKQHQDGTQKALADLRAEFEATGTKSDALIEEKLGKMATEVAEKNAATEAKAKEMESRMEAISSAMARSGGSAETGNSSFEEAKSFARTAMSLRGQLKAGIELTDEVVDAEGYAEWKSKFDHYLRRDERAIEQRALSVGSDPDGGYLVPDQMSQRILTQVFESSPIRQLATVETVSTDALEFPVDENEFGVGWIGEVEAPTETSTAQVGVQRIPVHEQFAKPRATNKFLEDAGVDVESWLAGKVAEKFARHEASAFVTGNGVKQPRGFLDYGAGTGRGQIERTNSGDANLLTADGLINLSLSLKSAYAPGAAWLMKRSTVAAVMTLKGSDNNYLWRPGLEAGRPSQLLGAPVYEADDMPAVAANALAVAYGNFRMGYTVVDRLGITTLRDPYSSKPFVEFYSRRRVGGDVTTFEAIKLQVISA